MASTQAARAEHRLTCVAHSPRSTDNSRSASSCDFITKNLFAKCFPKKLLVVLHVDKLCVVPTLIRFRPAPSGLVALTGLVALAELVAGDVGLSPRPGPPAPRFSTSSLRT